MAVFGVFLGCFCGVFSGGPGISGTYRRVPVGTTAGVGDVLGTYVRAQAGTEVGTPKFV